MKRRSGFTLIELVVTMAIIAVISAIAYPAYMDYVLTAKRAEAKAALSAFSNAMEQYRTINKRYTGAAEDGADNGKPDLSVFAQDVPTTGTKKTYNLTLEGVTDNAYTVVATPIDADPACSTLKLDQDGNRTPAGCW